MSLWSAAILAAVLAVPFVPQEQDTCGPAALAMVLRFWGAEASHDALAAELGARELKGVAGSRLAEAARSRGMTAVAYAATTRSSASSSARAVRSSWRGTWAAGASTMSSWWASTATTWSCTIRREGASRPVKRETFEERWAGAGHWTLLVMPAGP